jgi:hypothetical protein
MGALCLGRLGVWVGSGHELGLATDRAGASQPDPGGARLQFVAGGDGTSGDAHRIADMQRPPVDRDGLCGVMPRAAVGSMSTAVAGNSSRRATSPKSAYSASVMTPSARAGGDCDRPQVHLVRSDDRVRADPQQDRQVALPASVAVIRRCSSTLSSTPDRFEAGIGPCPRELLHEPHTPEWHLLRPVACDNLPGCQLCHRRRHCWPRSVSAKPVGTVAGSGAWAVRSLSIFRADPVPGHRRLVCLNNPQASFAQ